MITYRFKPSFIHPLWSPENVGRAEHSHETDYTCVTEKKVSWALAEIRAAHSSLFHAIASSPQSSAWKGIDLSLAGPEVYRFPTGPGFSAFPKSLASCNTGQPGQSWPGGYREVIPQAGKACQQGHMVATDGWETFTAHPKVWPWPQWRAGKFSGLLGTASDDMTTERTELPETRFFPAKAAPHPCSYHMFP